MKMQWILSSFALSGLLFVVGCGNQGTEGGPGAQNEDGQASMTGPNEEAFVIDVPTLSTTVAQGEAENVTLSIDRGEGFTDEVNIEFADLPEGIMIEPSSATIAPGDTEATISVKASADAAVGDFKVKVKATPSEGATATNELAITVSKSEKKE